MNTTTTEITAPGPGDDTPTRAATPFRWRLAHRPDVRFGHAAGGVAGILLAVATVAFVVAVTDDEPRLPGVAFTALLIVLALGAGFLVRGPVRSAAVAAVTIAIPLLWVFAILGGGGRADRGDFRIILLLTIAGYVVLYLLTWTRGRAVLLGLALLFAANWVVFEVARQEVPLAVGLADRAQTGEVEGPGGVLFGNDRQTETAVADVAIAIVLLGAGIALDRTRKSGAATPCLLVGGFYAVNAAVAFGIDVDSVYAAGAFVAVAGLAIGLAGSLGRRRGTSWIGAGVLLAGVLVLIAQGTEDTASGGSDATATRFGIYAVLGALVLLTVGMVVSRQLAEPVDGGEPGGRRATEPPPGPPPVPPEAEAALAPPPVAPLVVAEEDVRPYEPPAPPVSPAPPIGAADADASALEPPGAETVEPHAPLAWSAPIDAPKDEEPGEPFVQP